MSDYREFLRKAILALPVNSGAARRAVYERARATFADQLRRTDPAISTREVTERRLQFEDCIRQVEQEVGARSN